MHRIEELGGKRYAVLNNGRGLELPYNFEGVLFEERPDCKYKQDYLELFNHITSLPWGQAKAWWRELAITDSWFFVYFVMGVSVANHPFWVEVCKEVDEGPQSMVMDIWAREHGKSTVVTICKSIQRVLADPEQRIAIFSYVKPVAAAFLRSIKLILEGNHFLKAVFPDVLYENPGSEAFRWSEEAGLYVKRKSTAKEATFEAHGLVEGMPTSRHFTGMVFDDIMTLDMADSPEMIEKVKEMFDMAQNLGSEGCWQWILGTPYHHQDVLAYIEGKKFPDGKPIYTVRKKPATEGGLANGKPVLLSQERLDALKANKRQFRSQQLLDPTPQGEQRLAWENIDTVFPIEVPQNLYKFMLIDPASDKEVADSWAVLLCGVEPYSDDLGASDIYLLDAVIEPMDLIRAQQVIVDMYCKHSFVLKVGVEKVGASTFEIHISNALRQRGRCVTIDSENLVVLRPGGRSKELRIEAALSWPLLNSKIHFSSAVPAAYRERLVLEMKKFPFWHDDGLDALSYTYDVIKDYRFGRRPVVKKPDTYADKKAEQWRVDGWMAC